MSDARPGLGQRLIDLTAAFFEAKLCLRPGKVSVLEEDEGFLVLVVEGFLSRAEATLVEDPRRRRALTEYYGRVLDQLSPLLRVVLSEVGDRALIDCRAIPDLSRDECRYLLRLAPGDSHRPVPPSASSSPRLDRGRGRERKSS